MVKIRLERWVLQGGSSEVESEIRTRASQLAFTATRDLRSIAHARWMPCVCRMLGATLVATAPPAGPGDSKNDG